MIRRLSAPARLAIGAVLAGLCGLPAAAPTLEVRARTELRLHGVRSRGDGTVAIIGRLIDPGSGVGVGDRAIRARAAGRALTAVTATDGSFQMTFPDPSAAIDVALEFEGDRYRDPTRVEQRGIDASRALVALDFAVAPDPLGARVVVNATSDDALAELPIVVQIFPDARSRPVEVAVTSGAQFSLRRTAVGGPGVKRMVARFLGDSRRGAATAETTVELVSGTSIDLALDPTDVPFEAAVRAHGRVLDDDGAPAARVAVAVVEGARRIGTATTGADGRWELELSASTLGAGRYHLQAIAETRESWRTPSRSAPIAIAIGVPSPAPIGMTIAALLITTAAALGIGLGRRRRARPRPAAPMPPETRPDPRGGLRAPARPTSTRRASDRGFTGGVRDAIRRRPLAAASVRLSRPTSDQVVAVATADDGTFAVDELLPGEWTVRVAAPGHVAEEFRITVPHRGELRDVAIELVPVRDQVFALYRRAAAPQLPSPGLWGIWSPRQIVDHVRARRLPSALGDLTDFVEEVYFSSRPLDESILAVASAKVDAALAERR